MRVAAILTTFFALVVALALAVLPNRICFSGGENYTFFIGDSSKYCREVRSSFPEAERLTLNEVCGESCEYKNLDIEEFLKGVNGKVVFKEELFDSVNYYCTADLPYSVSLYGNEINLHISVKDDGVKVGSPIIFGGY